MKVLLTNASLLPHYGGPARSVSKLAEILADAGIDVSIWAADGSAMNTPFIPAAATLQRLDGRVAGLFDKFGKPDIVHDNGIWWAHNHRLARLGIQRGIPRVVSTRGALEPWARNHKRLKKRVAWWLYQRRDLQRARSHHATSLAEHVQRPQERDAAAQQLGQLREHRRDQERLDAANLARHDLGNVVLDLHRVERLLGQLRERLPLTGSGDRPGHFQAGGVSCGVGKVGHGKED